MEFRNCIVHYKRTYFFPMLSFVLPMNFIPPLSHITAFSVTLTILYILLRHFVYLFCHFLNWKIIVYLIFSVEITPYSNKLEKNGSNYHYCSLLAPR